MNKNDITLFQNALDYAVNKTKANIDYFKDEFPAACSENLIYRKLPNASLELGSDWTSSFYSGMVWLAYEYTKDEFFKNEGIKHIESFKERLEKRDIVGHHDVGFLYILSCLAGYRAANIDEGKKVSVDAAYVLAERYQEKIQILQQNYSLTEESVHRGRFIIDSTLNIPLLYWASEITGDKSLYEKGYNHLKQIFKYICREDGSTYQVCRLNADTGELIEQTTGQGFSAEGCWSRGQAWAIYGLALSYGYTGDEECILRSKKAADYFLANLPEDGICAWDLWFKDNETQKDTSAAAIAACGLMELSELLPESDSDKARYMDEAVKMIKTLVEKYSTEGMENTNGILTEGVYSLPGKLGVNECQIWGDYFYMEALYRLLKPWRSYWKK